MTPELYIIRLRTRDKVEWTTAVSSLGEVAGEVERLTGRKRYPADVFRWACTRPPHTYPSWRKVEHIAWPS